MLVLLFENNYDTKFHSVFHLYLFLKMSSRTYISKSALAQASAQAPTPVHTSNTSNTSNPLPPAGSLVTIGANMYLAFRIKCYPKGLKVSTPIGPIASGIEFIIPTGTTITAIPIDYSEDASYPNSEHVLSRYTHCVYHRTLDAVKLIRARNKVIELNAYLTGIQKHELAHRIEYIRYALVLTNKEKKRRQRYIELFAAIQKGIIDSTAERVRLEMLLKGQ
jgi:hypothetical protein